MNKFRKFIGMAVFALVAVPVLHVNALEANDEATLKDALVAGGEVTLTDNIEVTSPLSVSKDITLNGGGFTISASETFVNEGSNGSIIAVIAPATATLKNVTISGAKKYGVQAYNGGKVILDGVTIEKSGFGALLVNGGSATILDLTMNNNAYGIEFGQGVNVDKTPSLTMNGSIKGSQNEMLVLAANDNLGEVIVKNEETSTMKLTTDGKKLILVDNAGKTISSSNEAKDGVKVDGDIKVEPTPTPTPTATPKPDEKPGENPDTFDGIGTYIALAILGCGALLISSKKVFQA